MISYRLLTDTLKSTFVATLLECGAGYIVKLNTSPPAEAKIEAVGSVHQLHYSLSLNDHSTTELASFLPFPVISVHLERAAESLYKISLILHGLQLLHIIFAVLLRRNLQLPEIAVTSDQKHGTTDKPARRPFVIVN